MNAQVLVTGANGNLGTAVVSRMLEDGYRVHAVDTSDLRLNAVKNHPQFHFYQVDLLSEPDVFQFSEKLRNDHGALRAAILLAGGFSMGSLDELTGTAMRKMMDLNFETALHLTRAFLPSFRSQGFGRLIYVGARPGLQLSQGTRMAAYALSKHLVFALAELVNASEKKHNITASVIVPSTIDTALNRESMPDADFSHWVTPTQLAGVISFLIGEAGEPLRETIVKVYNQS